MSDAFRTAATACLAPNRPAGDLVDCVTEHFPDVEAYRDCLLQASGNLDDRMGGPSSDLDREVNRRRTVYARISRGRSASVKDAMVAQGMDGSSIATSGKSFDDPLVPTGPGVREPQNRRAVIVLGDGSGT